MHSLCLAVGALNGAIGFALLFAGFLSLVGQDASERAASRERYTAARTQGGGFAEYVEYVRVRNQVTSIARMAKQWPRRVAARKMIYVGATALVIAILAWTAASLWFGPPPTPNQGTQRTASKAATDTCCVCHCPFACVASCSGPAIADLASS